MPSAKFRLDLLLRRTRFRTEHVRAGLVITTTVLANRDDQASADTIRGREQFPPTLVLLTWSPLGTPLGEYHFLSDSSDLEHVWFVGLRVHLRMGFAEHIT